MTTQHRHPMTGVMVNHTRKGVVVKSETWEGPGAFRIATGRQEFPFAVIYRDCVTKILYDDGSTVAAGKLSPKVEVKKYRVKGSENKAYIVTVVDGHNYSCSCKGYEFRRTCRHINKVVEYLK